MTRSALALTVLLICPSAQAWNAAGHKVIGLIAYDQLSEEAQAAAVALLKDHPRFDQHFLGRMPQEVWNGSDAEKDQWIFAYATHWSDVVRNESDVVTEADVKRFNRPTWHYVTRPVWLSEADREGLEGGLRVNVDSDPPEGRDARWMNVIQAIKNSRRIVADKTASRADRAVHLCWLLHLIGDCHQPCHGASLFTRQRFPEGDRGANSINIRGKKRLHAFWDDAILDDGRYNRARSLAAELLGEKRAAAWGREALETTSVDAWLRESNALAAEHVYAPHVRRLVAEAEGRDKLGAMNPPKDYYVQAAKVARQRAVEAGYRLALVCQEGL